MKIRTDFVTNSSSSGFVVISVTMRDGTEYEIEREYDTGFGGYFWASVSESMDDALPELKNGLELLELLRSNINDFEEFILFEDKQGIAFKENVSAINDFNDVRSIIIAEQTQFDDGGSDSCRLEFTNKTAKSEATVTRSKYEDENRNNAYTYVGIRSARIVDLSLALTEGDTFFDHGPKGKFHVHEDIFSFVVPCNIEEYQWNKKMDYDLEIDEVGIARLLVPLIPELFILFQEELRDILHEAVEHNAVTVHTKFRGDFQPLSFAPDDFGQAKLLVDSYGQVIECEEKVEGCPHLTIPAFTSLKARVFSNCKITKYILTEAHVNLSWATFISCKSLEMLTLGSGNETLHRQLCEGCSALRVVNLPADVYRIEERAFFGCINLEEINIPDSVLYIDPTAFSGCTKLPLDTMNRIQQLTDKEAFDRTICEAERYIQTHGDAKYRFGSSYGSLFKKKAEYERWYDIHAPYFDQPEALPKGKVVYSVYAPNDVAINMSTYGWKQQKALTSSVEYLVVDTTVIPNFDRFLYKIDAIDRGDLQKAKNFGSNMLEKAIELKKSNQPIKIITKAYLDSCIAANAFVAIPTGPSKAELRAQEAKAAREAKAALKENNFEKLVRMLQEHCANTGKKFESFPKVTSFVFAMGINLENYKKQIKQSHNMTLPEYFVHIGVLSTPKMRFEEMIDVLTERYRISGQKVTTMGQLEQENPDLDVSSITNNARVYSGLAARELLIQRGIMYSDEELQPKDTPASQQRDPAQLPENIRKRMDTLFANLDLAYPDKVIVHLNRDHKKWGETVTALYRALDYESPKDFLTAYGYTYATDDKGGRPKKNPMEIIEELQRRYPNGTDFTTVDELKAANPDIASRFQSLRNKSNEYFGMPFTQYLRSIGLIK